MSIPCFVKGIINSSFVIPMFDSKLFISSSITIVSLEHISELFNISPVFGLEKV